jgi:rubrerythrin
VEEKAMAVTTPKKTLNKEEIIEILRRNARLFKDEPEFINYIVDLAIYLLENFVESKKTHHKSTAIEAAAFRATPQELKKAYLALEKFTAKKPLVRSCPICGAAVEGKRRCPNCNAMTF